MPPETGVKLTDFYQETSRVNFKLVRHEMITRPRAREARERGERQQVTSPWSEREIERGVLLAPGMPPETGVKLTNLDQEGSRVNLTIVRHEIFATYPEALLLIYYSPA